MEIEMGQSKQGEQTTITIFLKYSFHTLSFTILSLLLPLSFLLLARLITSPHLLNSTNPSSTPIFSTLLATSLHAGPLLLCLLVSFTCVSSLLYELTGHRPRPRIGVAWLVLYLFQACVNLGIEATVAAGFKPIATTGFQSLNWIERAVFLIGLYETMLTWSKMFVRPVVDDTIFGTALEEECTDKVVMGVAFIVLWVWFLQGEVEQLVIGAWKKGLGIGMGLDGFVCWLVGYVTVMTGMVRIVEGIGGMAKVFFRHRREAGEASVCSALVTVNTEV